MKIWAGVLACVASLALFTGCESWNWGGSASDYNESGGWQNVSGVYTGANGDYLVSSYSNLIPVNTNGVPISENIGTTVAGQVYYSGTLSHIPLKPSSITLFVGNSPSVTFVGDESGALTSGGGSGSINYQTGAWSVTLTAAPVGDQPIWAVFMQMTGGGLEPGGSSVITSFTVVQSGNQISVTDNNGCIYSGNLALTSTNTSATTNMVTLRAEYAYDVRGVSAAGFKVEMVGNFIVNGSLTGTNVDTNNTSFVNFGTAMTGTWLEEGGKTGHIKGSKQ